LAFYTGTDDLRLPFSEDADVALNYGNQTLSATWTHIFSDNIFSNFTATGSRYFNYPSFNIGGTPFERSNNIYDFSLKGDIDYYHNDSHDISAGFWVGQLTLKLRIPLIIKIPFSRAFSRSMARSIFRMSGRFRKNGRPHPAFASMDSVKAATCARPLACHWSIALPKASDSRPPTDAITNS